jgi:small subunit ribosomal protein S7
MPRRREVPERVIIPDAKHNSKLVSKFVASHHARREEKYTPNHCCTGLSISSVEKTNEDPAEGF